MFGKGRGTRGEPEEMIEGFQKMKKFLQKFHQGKITTSEMVNLEGHASLSDIEKLEMEGTEEKMEGNGAFPATVPERHRRRIPQARREGPKPKKTKLPKGQRFHSKNGITDQENTGAEEHSPIFSSRRYKPARTDEELAKIASSKNMAKKKMTERLRQEEIDKKNISVQTILNVVARSQKITSTKMKKDKRKRRKERKKVEQGDLVARQKIEMSKDVGTGLESAAEAGATAARKNSTTGVFYVIDVPDATYAATLRHASP